MLLRTVKGEGSGVGWCQSLLFVVASYSRRCAGWRGGVKALFANKND